MTRSRLYVLLLLLLTLSGVALGQATLVVDASGAAPGSFATLSGALAVAGDGDLLLMKSGTYDSVTIHGLSVTLLADQGADVTIRHFVAVTGLASQQHVELRGITFLSEPAFFEDDQFAAALRLKDNQGIVWVEDCRMIDFFQAVLVENSRVALVRCEMEGMDASGPSAFSFGLDPGEGLFATDSTVVLDRCQLRGGLSGVDTLFMIPTTCGSGTRLENSDSVLVSSTSIGRDGYDGGPSGFSCFSGAHGGNGLVASDSSAVQTVGTNLIGGSGSDGFGFCPGGDAGVPALVSADSVLVDHPSTVERGVRFQSPVRAGQPQALQVTGEVGDLVFLLWSGKPQLEILPDLLHAQLTRARQFQLVGQLTSTQLDLVSLAGPLVPGTSFRKIYAQTAHMSPAGAMILGGPSTAHVIDPAIP